MLVDFKVFEGKIKIKLPFYSAVSVDIVACCLSEKHIVTLIARIKSAWIKLNNLFLNKSNCTTNYYSDYVQINFVVQLE